MFLGPQVLKKFSPASADDLTTVLASFGFDPLAYRDRHQDLKQLGMTADDALKHYLMHGIVEDRDPAISPSFEKFHSSPGLSIINDEARLTLFTNLLNKWVIHPDITQANWELALETNTERLLQAGFDPFVIIGDSHSYAYSHTVALDKRLLVPVHLLCSGGSALGLANETSKSGYGRKITDVFSRQTRALSDKKLSPFFKFGQVDAEFVSVFRRVKHGQTAFVMADFEAFAQESVAGYSRFISQLLHIHPYPEAFRICSIFPPILSDTEWSKGYMNAHIGYLESDNAADELAESIRHLEIPTLLRRTNMHAFYNGLLQNMCARLGLIFINDFAPLLTNSGLVHEKYFNGHGGRDHHIPVHLMRPVLDTLITTYAEVAPLGTSAF